LRHFVERLGGAAIQVQGHPPAFLLLLSLLGRAGLGGPRWAAAIIIGAGAAAAPATLVAIREMAGEQRARYAAPFLSFAPAAIWVATSADAFFMGTAAWAVALLVLSTAREFRRGSVLAVVGGLLFGLALFLTYGAVLVALVPLAVFVVRRRLGLALLATGATAVVMGGFFAAGFSWFSGLLATRRLYFAGIAGTRPYSYFLVADLALFAVVVGPAAIAGLLRLRHRGAWLLAGGGLVAVAVADVSGLSKAEVERVWLMFAPWVLVGTAALDTSPQVWLALQTAVGLVVQVAILSPW
jgi:hypothetical protein